MSDTDLAQAEAAVVAAWNLPDPQGDWDAKHARYAAIAEAFRCLFRAAPLQSGTYYVALVALGEAERRRDSAAEIVAAKQTVSS